MANLKLILDQERVASVRRTYGTAISSLSRIQRQPDGTVPIF